MSTLIDDDADIAIVVVDGSNGDGGDASNVESQKWTRRSPTASAPVVGV